TTASLIPSFTYGDGLGTWYSRSTLVSFSVKSRASGCWSAARTYHQRAPSTSCAVEAAPGPMAVIVERGTPGSHVQTLRYHRCGKTCIGAGSGPRLIAVMRQRMSSACALAYSMHTSK